MKPSPLARALRPSVLGLLWLVLLPATAQASDVTLTINPTGYIGGGVVTVNGGVSCSSTSVHGSEPLSTSIRQDGVEVRSDFGQAFCEPFTRGSWAAVVEAGQLHPGRASVTVRLTLEDGTNVIATGSVRLIIPNKPSVDHIDQFSDYESLRAFCGFPLNSLYVHDVGLLQTWFEGLTTKFVGNETITNLDTGKSVVLKQSLRVTTELLDGSHTFTGLNYRIRTSSGQLVSAGRGVVSEGGEDLTATPHLIHAFPVLCRLLS